MRALFFFLTALAAQCGIVGTIRVEGNARYPASAVIEASGLKAGASASREDFEAAAQRLMDTGLFASTNYRWVSAHLNEKPVMNVTLEVAEIPDLRPCRIQIPGSDEEAVWAWLAKSEPMVQKRLPTNEAAESFYVRAIERFMAEALGRKEKVIVKLNVSMDRVFRPEVLPKVAALRFDGNRSIAAADLAKALGRVANGSEYTELDFRTYVEYNVRPLYENLGRLRVGFPRFNIAPDATGGLTVTTVVEEGEVYRLQALDLVSEDLPPDVRNLMQAATGEAVNWQALTGCAQKMEMALKHYGYLNASSKLDRKLDDQQHLARVTVTIRMGPQSLMGELRFVGLDPESEARNRARWPIAPGAPLDIDAVRSFSVAVARQDVKLMFDLQPRAGTDLVDVVYTIRVPK